MSTAFSRSPGPTGIDSRSTNESCHTPTPNHRGTPETGGSEFRQRFAGDGLLLNLLDEFPLEISAASHEELGAGRSFRLDKVRLAQMTEEELLQLLSHE